MCTMSFQWSGNLSLSLGFNSRQAGRRTFHRQTTRHRYIGTIGTGTFIDQLPVLLQPGFLVYFLLDDANSHPSNWLIHKSLSPCLCPLCPQFYSFFSIMFPKSLFLTQLVIAGRAIHYFKQADFFKEVDRVNNCLHFTSGSYFLHSFLLHGKKLSQGVGSWWRGRLL